MRLVLLFVAVLFPCSATAQDLFELEVFEYDTPAPGRYEIGIHTNVMSGGGVAPESTSSNHRPTHVSIEVTRGWTTRFETALFLQSAPFGSSGSDRFAGGHLRGKLRIGELPRFPLRFAASAEYAFNRAAFDHELQTFETRGIVELSQGRLSLVANPSVEIVTRGDEDGVAPVFDFSARAAWALTSRVTLAGDYFGAAATTRHLQTEPTAHRLLFLGADVALGSDWRVGVSTGHCVTSAEPWVVRSLIRYAFGAPRASSGT